jgi:murein L,D-transpeptidase YcbB/YkuD
MKTIKILNGVAIGAMITAAAPAVAANPIPATPAMTMPSLPSDASVQRFYATRSNAPLWFSAGRPSPAAMQLVSILQRASLDGLSTGPQLATQATIAMQRAQAGNPADVLAADKILSGAWVLYSQALERPTGGMEYGEPYLAPRPKSGDAILAVAAAAPSLAQHIAEVSHVNDIYASLRDAAWAEKQATGAVSQRLAANLDRARVLPGDGKFIIVNVANQRLTMYEHGKPVDSMKVIVGKPVAAKETPLVASRISYATFNPYWHVPPEMTGRIIANNVLRLGDKYLINRGYQVVSGYTDDARVLSRDEVNWKDVKSGKQQVWVRQLPGPGNSMGKLKFQFPNKTGIYLHDSPERELFKEDVRYLSAGCIRLEDAHRLGDWLLQRDATPPSDAPEQNVLLPKGVPVYVTYLTAQSDGSKVTYLDDAYGLDASAARMAAAN